MSDDSQVTVPRSFTELYLQPGRSKPTEPARVIAQHYELCEDLARAVAQSQAGKALDDEWQDVLVAQVRDAFKSQESALQEREADWVGKRAVEIIQHGL
jgi:hypothetical protein